MHVHRFAVLGGAAHPTPAQLGRSFVRGFRFETFCSAPEASEIVVVVPHDEVVAAFVGALSPFPVAPLMIHVSLGFAIAMPS